MGIVFRCIIYGGCILAWLGALNYSTKKLCDTKIYIGVIMIVIGVLEAAIYYAPY